MDLKDFTIGQAVKLCGSFKGTGTVLAVSDPEMEGWIKNSNTGSHADPDEDHVLRVRCEDGKTRWYSEVDLDEDVVEASETKAVAFSAGSSVTITIGDVKITIQK